MKCKLFLGIGLVLFFSNQLFAQNLSDNFNGTSVDTNLWNVVLPFAQSQMVETNGSITTIGRGTLESRNGFTAPYLISGAVTLNDGEEHFEITLRSDFSTEAQPGLTEYYILTGIYIGFSMDGQQVSIQQMDNTTPNPPILAEKNFNLIGGQQYNFQISDDGIKVTLAINGTNVLSASTGFRSGNKIAFQSREFDSTSSSLDFIQATENPVVSLIKAVKPSLSNLSVGTNYQLQVSSDLIHWTNNGLPFIATTNILDYPQYFDAANWDSLFFRLQTIP